MDDRPHITIPLADRTEAIVIGMSVSFLLILALFAMAAPDPIMCRRAPLQVETLR